MRSNPKIVVLKTREIIYTLLLAALVILLVVCLVLMFTEKREDGLPGSGSASGSGENTTSGSAAAPDNTAAADPSPESSVSETLLPEQSPETVSYRAGVYTAPLTLGDSTVDVEVTVDQNHINGIRLVNLSETAAAAYPLVSPSLEHITSQILEKQSLEGITSPQENRYTSQLLLSAVAEALETARAD